MKFSDKTDEIVDFSTHEKNFWWNYSFLMALQVFLIVVNLLMNLELKYLSLKKEFFWASRGPHMAHSKHLRGPQKRIMILVKSAEKLWKLSSKLFITLGVEKVFENLDSVQLRYALS